MKLIHAIRTIEQNGRTKSTGQRGRLKTIDDNGRMKLIEEHKKKNLVHVQSVFLYEDVISLKQRTRKSNVKDAISKAVYHYLKCKKTDEDKE